MSGKARQASAKRRGSRRASRADQRPPSFLGWSTTDREEIERRRWRGRTEALTIEASPPDRAFFGTFRIRAESGASYDVEIRSLASADNSCGCIDHQVNGLGTCKHIEGLLVSLRRGRARAFDRTARTGCPTAEVYLCRRDETGIRILWPATDQAAPLRRALGGFFADDGSLLGDPLTALPALRQAIDALPPALRAGIRLSRYLDDWLDDQRGRRERRRARDRYLDEVARGEAEAEVLRHPLLPYQQDGMLHLAFGERALLADEMGLGKTAQAIAACELLRRRRGIARVLVVCPASLKGEWQDQIAKFSGLSTQIVEGSRANRRQCYRQPAFFNICNYEQIIPDGPDINGTLAPDVVILDEAQRIKNWQTKTARAVKGLASPYAFVLTGTPLENRIDEIYSIVQYLDPGLLGPLFRFNRAFYRLDERGRPVDYRNLDALRQRLEPVMLRRRKSDVEDQLPARTVTNYFVAMSDEQRRYYGEYEAMAARLLAITRRRSLTKEEFDRLQKWLACMRMVCDTPYILDPDSRACPKLEELEGILADLLAEPDCKVVIFSEWVRMLDLVGELARAMDVDAARHTGGVPQPRRRAEIRRFKDDPACRLLLSSDSGSVGLNLQAANVVINLDLPWNPAKLEQRIARAWRKHQRRSVSVINLITEDSIEHRILHLLSQKQGLADGILDGEGDLDALRMPSGRKAFIERLTAAMTPPAAPARAPRESFAERLQADMAAHHGESLLLLEVHRDDSGRERVLAVLDGKTGTPSQEAERLAGTIGAANDGDTGDTPDVQVLDRDGYAQLRRLADAGIIAFVGETRQLHRAAALDVEDDRHRQRLMRARARVADAARKLRMAALLAGGGFAVEARAPLQEAITGAVTTVAALSNGSDSGEAAASETLAESTENLVAKGLFDHDVLAAVSAVQNATAEPMDGQVDTLIGSAESVLAQAEAAIEHAEAGSI